MSLLELAALARRHVLAVAMVFLVAAGTAYAFKHTPPSYQESATLVFTLPESGSNPNPYAAESESLITTGGIMVQWLMSAQAQQQVRAAGATGDFDAALFNSSNLEYPDYAEPYVTVSATAQDPVAAHDTFAVVTQVFNDDLEARQAQEDVPPDARITVRVIGDSGPLPQQGSRARSFAGLLLLTIVTAYLAARFLDRHPVRLPGLRRSPGHSTRGPAPRDPLAGPAHHGSG